MSVPDFRPVEPISASPTDVRRGRPINLNDRMAILAGCMPCSVEVGTPALTNICDLSPVPDGVDRLIVSAVAESDMPDIDIVFMVVGTNGVAYLVPSYSVRESTAGATGVFAAYPICLRAGEILRAIDPTTGGAITTMTARYVEVWI